MEGEDRYLLEIGKGFREEMVRTTVVYFMYGFISLGAEIQDFEVYACSINKASSNYVCSRSETLERQCFDLLHSIISLLVIRYLLFVITKSRYIFSYCVYKSFHFFYSSHAHS